MDEELKKIVQNMINAGESEANIALVIRSYKPTTVKKKDTPLSTAPKESMELEQKVGSSDSQKPKGFPEIDTNGILPDFDKMKSVKSPIPAKPKEDEVESFGGALVNRLDAGISRVSKSIYDMPSMLYDLGTQITNPAMTAVSNATGKSPSEILAKELNFENIPSKMMEEKIKESDAKIANYKKEIGGDIMTSYNKGDYINTFKHAALNSMESVPLIGLAMATGGESAIANLAIGTSTASTQYDQLSKEHPELETKDKLKNAAISGISEVIVGKFIEGVSGNVWKSLLANKGTKEGAKIATNSFKKSVEKAVGKSPILAGVGEYAEERIVDAIQQYSDINTGIKQEFDWEQNKGAGLSSLGFSAPNVVGMYGVKGYVNNQTKNQVKKANNAVLSLQKDLENPNLSEEQKATINTSIKDIYAKNKQILGAELKKFHAIPENEKVELLKIDEDIDELKSQAIEIKHSNDISEESKAVLLDNLKSKALKANNRKEEILSKSTKINFGELPLKEQETIKKQAMESLVTELNPDGKKDMTITDQMVTKRANEIYTESNQNEKENAKIEVPTPETKSEAEVKEQPKADKVATPPVEDVVAPSVKQESVETAPIVPESKAETVETAQVENVDVDNNLRKEKQLEVINNSNPAPNDYNTWIRTTNDIKTANEVFEIAFNEGEMYPDFTVDNMKDTLESGEVTIYSSQPIKEGVFVTPSKMNAEEYAGGKGGKIYSKKIKVDDIAWIDESEGQYAPIKQNKETPEISPLEKAKQARIEAKAKLEAKRNATKEEVADKTPNIDNVENFINQTYSNNGNEPTTEANKGTKIDSVQENSGINKSEGKEQLTTKKKRAGNRTPLDKRQIKDPIMLSALKAEPFSATDLVQQYIIGGGRLTPDALNEVIATKNSKSSDVKARMSYLRTTQKGGKSFWHTIDSLMEKADELGISEDDIRNALIDVIHSHHSPKSMANDFVSRNGVFEKNKNGEVVNESGEVLVETPYGLLTNEQIKDLEAYEEANKDFGLNKEEFQEALSSLDQLTDAEIIELAENQEKSFKEYLEDLEKRQVTFDWYAFSGETGTIQPDGSIINDKGEYFSKEEVSNVKQLYPESKVEIKKPISKDTPELKEVNEKLEKANEKLRIAKDALDRKAKALDKELVRDNEDIFGERKNQNENKLFDERVDVNARNKATEKERKAITDAQNEIKSLKEAKAKIENKEITPTSEIDFNVNVVEKQIKEQVKNGNITQQQVDEFVESDRKSEEIEPIVKAIESKAKSGNKVELEQAVKQSDKQITPEQKPTDRGVDGKLPKHKGKSLKEQENKRPDIVVQAESLMPPTEDFLSKQYEIDDVQKQGVNSVLTLFKNGGKAFLLADGTGVGKTRQILVTAKEFANKFGGKVLIISENTTILTKNFAKDAEALGIDIGEFEFGTYSDLRTGKAGKKEYGLVIYDEAHNLKNQESGKAIAASNIKAKHNLYVTATPMDTISSAVYFITEVSGISEVEAYSQLGLNVKMQKDPKTGQQIKIVTLKEGVAPADIKRNIIKIREQIIANGAMLRREYPFYGEFIEDKISMTESQIEEHDDIESSWDDRIEYESMNDNGTVNIRKKMNLSGQKSGELSRWSESTKIKYTLAEVEKEIKAGKKVVVIAEGVNETTITAIEKTVPGFLSELSKLLKAKGYKVAEIYGKADKGLANDQFQNNEVDVVLGTAKSASTGIDLDDQKGDNPRVLFMVTPNYSGNVFQQILGRVSRRNTKSPAQVRLLYNDSNIDARRKQIVGGKLQTLKAIQEGVIDDDIEIDTQLQETSAEPINISDFKLEDISEKAFVIKGDTRPIKDEIKAIGGRYNPKYGGWIFPKTKKQEVQELLNKLTQSSEQPKSEKSKVESAKESLKEATAKRKETKAKLDAKKRNQGIANDPKQDAQDLYDYHQALVAEAKEYIKLGVATLSEFADALGEKVSISVKQAWDEAKGIISPITKGEDLSYDFTSMNNEVKEVKETPKKEQKQAEKPKVAPKKEVVEETVTKKAKDLGITDSQYEGLRDKAKALPQSGEFSEYLSGETIEDVYDDKARNEQGYEVTKLQQLTDHGVAFLDKAKDLFGGDYVAKTLDFLHNSNLNTFEKGVIYASLVNEMDTLNKNFPDDMEFKKLQDAVYADYQANLRVGSLTINTGRLIRILNAIKTGVEVATFTSKLYSPQQKEAKTILENAVPTPERLNQNQEIEIEEAEESIPENEKIYTQEDFDRELAKAKEELGKDYSVSVFENLKRQAKKEKLSEKKEELKAQKEDIIKQIRRLANKQANTMSANPIPLEAFPLISKLAKVLIQEGAVNIENVIDDIHNTLKDVYANISKKDIANVLKSKPKRTMSDATKRKLYISLLNKNIDFLDKQIANKKREIITRTDKYKDDTEINELRNSVEAKKEELARIDPSYSTVKKLSRDLITAQASLDNYQSKIDNEDFSKTEKQPKEVDAKLAELRKKRDEKRKEFSKAKSEYQNSIKPPKEQKTAEEVREEKILKTIKEREEVLQDLIQGKKKDVVGNSSIWDKRISKVNSEIIELRKEQKRKPELTQEEKDQKSIDRKIKLLEDTLDKLKNGIKNVPKDLQSPWNEKISALQTDIKKLRDAKKKASKPQKTQEEIDNEKYLKDLESAINRTQKAIDAIENPVEKDNTGKKSVVSPELSALKTKLSILQQKQKDTKSNLKAIQAQKRSDSKISNVVKQALIDAGFSRDIRNNKTGEVRQVIDWTKLFGRAGTIESLKTKVEEQLKSQGKTDAEIAEIQTQLYEEYKRLSELIVDKAIADLERRNLVKPSPHRKSNAKRLADLYEQGLFDANLDKYENIVNAILGFSKTSQETFDKIKEQVKALSDLYAEQSDGRVLSELEITTQSNKIKRAINVLFFNSVMKEAPTHAKIALSNLQFGLWSLRSLLGSIKTLSENRFSGELQVRLSDLAFGRSSTKELRELNRRAKKMVSRDIRLYGAQPYGDTSMSLLAHSIIDDVINEKITTKAGHQIYNILSLRTFLDAVDSSVKVRLTNKHFVENAVNILMTKSDTRKAMTRKEAVQFVSEALTGDNFKKAEETAKNVIDEVNAKAGKKILKDNPEAIFRFAMDIVTKNLNSGEIMTMHEIEASFKAGVKSAGASIGHEANNIATVAVNSASQRLSKQLDKAITEQNWKTASVLAITSLIVKTTAMAFKGGGANWLVLAADKRIPLFGVGHALVRYKWDKNYKIDLDTETGRKGLEQSLYLQGQYRDTMMRGIYATGMFMVAAAAMGYKGDDEESNAEEFAKWLNKTENKWLKKYFYKIAPQSFSAFVAYESGLKEMPEYFGRMFDVGNEYYDKSVQLKRSLGSKQEGSTKEVLGQLSTAPFNAPLPWKAVKDIEEISRGLQGLKPIREEKSKKGFVKGMFKGGGIEYLGGLGKRLFGEKKEDKKTPN